MSSQKPKLVVVAGPRVGEVFEIGEAPFSIGRQSSNHLQLHHPSVSRRHCVVEPTADGAQLSDLESLCGTFVNGAPIRRRRLEHGELVKVGDSLFLYLSDVGNGEEEALSERFADVKSALDMSTCEAMVAAKVLPAAKALPEPATRRGLEHEIVGESPAMEQVFRLLSRVAPTDLTVLVLGESGTGKELVAQAIHSNSPRAAKPFVAVNCATLSETLLESELFGHEKGAFTGAVGRKVGQFEVAHGGTIFLDEVGEIPLVLQARLLRALEMRELRRVGGTKTIRVDVRLVAATNRDLEAAVRERAFREDLYHRLNIFALTLPPLRERREDIPLLASHFAARSARRLKRRLSGLSPEARSAITAHDWPGNVRELRNAVERAVVLATDDVLRPEDLPEAVLRSAPAGHPSVPAGTYQEAVARAKRRILRDAFRRAGGSYVEAAKRLGVNRTYLHRLISNLKLRSELGQ